MLYFARHCLVPGDLPIGRHAVLLEGDWPADGDGRNSLDAAIDGRHAWIDAAACDLAAAAESSEVAYLNVLRLRYYLVKLLRVVAFLKERDAAQCDSATLHAERGRDEDYALLLSAWRRQHETEFQVVWHEGDGATLPLPPSNPLWRRGAGFLARIAQSSATAGRSPRRPVVLCGNAAVLDPVCAELTRRGLPAVWLYDRFSAGCWRKWAHRGVGQVNCDSSLGRTNRFTSASLPPLEFDDFDLRPLVERWLARCAAEHGPRQTRLVERVEDHFRLLRPTAVIVDEDATPLARAVVAAARRHGAASFVLQHGAPYGRLGFAPLAADCLFAWGQSSRRRLASWGVPEERMCVAGSPRHDAAVPRNEARSGSPAPARGTRILLLATTPPSDERPDAIAFHLTTRTYRELFRAACAAIAGLPHAELIVKLHPRYPRNEVYRQVLAEFPALRSRLLSDGRLEDLLAGAACVLSCGSSAGVEAAFHGVPTIELLPAGSAELLPAAAWGFIGIARSEAEIAALLTLALGGQEQNPPSDEVFAHRGRAATQVVDSIERVYRSGTAQLTDLQNSASARRTSQLASAEQIATEAAA